MSKRKGDPGYADGWCIHYKGPPSFLEKDQRHVCEAGVDIQETFGGTKFGVWPCFLEKGLSKPGALSCPHLQRPTAEEITAHEEWVEGRMSKMALVFKAIEPWRKKHKGKSAQEVVECPACKGRLHLSISSYNGHVHGKCETDGCVSWME